MESYKGLEFDTVYIGGGTPTVLSQGNLKKVFYAIYKNFNICANSEIIRKLQKKNVQSGLPWKTPLTPQKGVWRNSALPYREAR